MLIYILISIIVVLAVVCLRQYRMIRRLRESLSQAEFEIGFYESEVYHWYESYQNALDWLARQ